MSTVSVNIKDGVATIAINNPPLNIITLKVMQELEAKLNELISNNDAKVIVLRSGNDKLCSAGADVKEHFPEMATDLITSLARLIKLLINYPKPTICVINGKCLGGGMELFTSCDFVVATDDAELAVPEIKLATFPPFAIALLPKLMSLHKVYEIVLTGKSVYAEEAKQLGLVNYVVSKQNLDDTLNKLINDLLSNSQAAVRLAKKAILLSAGLPIDEAIDAASFAYLSELIKLEDYVEGLRSFLEKRKPMWKNK
ncbi:MAG: enoyl-CoA hydratase/isomerase family protein [Vulcanisaeta sp.]|jgi:cyclohexa-1,5-dienecarbonyl-CoA hydratase|nr:enoyl-CoA hydratase/isomerase family protein [Vulcanisaeta sp.]